MTHNTQPQNVLIVDDDPSVATVIATCLENLGEGYVFEVAYSAAEALTKLQQTTFNLLITDYNMPDITGLDLAQAVRHISPGTQVVLMSAFGTEKMRKAAGHIDLAGYIEKPFDIHQILEIVGRAVEGTNTAKSGPNPYHSDEYVLDESICQHLKNLRVNTGARCVLLINSSGYPVSAVGQTKNLDIPSVSALVAANFLAAVELANLLGSNSSMFKSSYYEGNDYNIYSYDIDEELLLAVIFGSESKPGTVWYYTKQIAAELESLVVNHASQVTFSYDDVEAALGVELDYLLGEGQENNDRLGRSGGEKNNNGESSSFGGEDTNQDMPTEKKSSEKTTPMTFEKAVAAGLVPPEIVDRELGK